ncbi:MAG: hypothetical protein KF745_04160 [Phycisphaeraceae bacterium]|nr:hypothetical protein [Phycisphaeraceae bacterium]
MSVSVAQVRLRDGLKELKFAWAQVKDQWDDAARAKFEEDYLQQLDSKVRGAMAAMNRLAEVIAQSRRDCE